MDLPDPNKAIADIATVLGRWDSTVDDWVVENRAAEGDAAWCDVVGPLLALRTASTAWAGAQHVLKVSALRHANPWDYVSGGRRPLLLVLASECPYPEALPDLPVCSDPMTWYEAGYAFMSETYAERVPDLGSGSWFGLFRPRGIDGDEPSWKGREYAALPGHLVSFIVVAEHGITHAWTAKRFRRQGYATALGHAVERMVGRRLPVMGLSFVDSWARAFVDSAELAELTDVPVVRLDRRSVPDADA